MARKERKDGRAQQPVPNDDDLQSHYLKLANSFAQAPGLSDAAFRLYVILLSFCHAGKLSCYPGHSKLAEYWGVSTRTVIRAQNELVGKGWITVEHQSGRSNLYRLVASHRHAHVVGSTSLASVTSDNSDPDLTVGECDSNVTPPADRSVTPPVTDLSHRRIPTEETLQEEDPLAAALAMTVIVPLPERSTTEVVGKVISKLRTVFPHIRDETKWRPQAFANAIRQYPNRDLLGELEAMCAYSDCQPRWTRETKHPAARWKAWLQHADDARDESFNRQTHPVVDKVKRHESPSNSDHIWNDVQRVLREKSEFGILRFDAWTHWQFVSYEDEILTLLVNEAIDWCRAESDKELLMSVMQAGYPCTAVEFVDHVEAAAEQ
jgi:Helix-turn-helix domain